MNSGQLLDLSHRCDPSLNIVPVLSPGIATIAIIVGHDRHYNLMNTKTDFAV